MKVIGITGGIGSGKSTVSNIIKNNNFPLIDCDEISRELTQNDDAVLSEIRRCFGASVFDDNGNLLRQELANIVFSDSSKKKIPLLIETGLNRLCDVCVLVTADIETRINRVEKRDGISRDRVLERISNQMPESEKKAVADELIDNSGSIEYLNNSVERLINKYVEY